jgi:anti-anti-sigma regulatory factor
MNNAFFLLILPTRTLTIHLGSYQQCTGLSLRGTCTSVSDVTHLMHTVQQLLERRPAHAWIDGQQLHALSHLGQQALLRADACSQQAGTQLHWCGLSPALQHELQASGLSQKLTIQPATSYEGPNFLLPERPVTATRLPVLTD